METPHVDWLVTSPELTSTERAIAVGTHLISESGEGTEFITDMTSVARHGNSTCRLARNFP